MASKKPQAAKSMSTARTYQVRLLERAKHENMIAVLDTGTGKTLIAVLLIRHMSELDALAVSKGTGQADYVRHNCDLRVKHYYGALGIDGWGVERWGREVAHADVMVMTPEIFKNLLHAAYIRMDQVNLIVFDECHHARKYHPYNQIMSAHYDPRSDNRPKIFGMTASPGVSKKTDSSQAIRDLEKNLHCKAFTVHHEDVEELRRFAPKPKEEIIYFPRGPFFPLPSLYEIMANLGGYSIGNVAKALDKALTTSDELGPWLADRSLEAFLIELGDKVVRKIKTDGQPVIRLQPRDHEKLSSVNFLARVCDLLQKKAALVVDDAGPKAGDTANETATSSMTVSSSNTEKEKDPATAPSNPPIINLIPKFPPPPPVTDDVIAPKVQTLINILTEYRDNPQQFCGIVFVEQRNTARILHLVVKHCEKLNDFVRSAVLIGHGGGRGSGGGDDKEFKFKQHMMDVKEQQQVVKQFRTGEVNLLIATKVAEEGLDIQPCMLVIRFDMFHTVASYVQSRGRARHHSSRYVVMAEENNTNHSSQWHAMKSVEQAMQEKLRANPGSRGSKRKMGEDGEELEEGEEEEDEEDSGVEESDAALKLSGQDIYRVKSTGALATMHTAVSLVHRYCALLPRDAYCNFKPIFEFIDADEDDSSVDTTVGSVNLDSETATPPATSQIDELEPGEIPDDNPTPAPDGIIRPVTNYDMFGGNRPLGLVSAFLISAGGGGGSSSSVPSPFGASQWPVTIKPPTPPCNAFFVCRITLPVNTPVSCRVVTGPARESKKAAKRAAAFETVKKLHQIGELDDRLRPAFREWKEKDLRMVGPEGAKRGGGGGGYDWELAPEVERSASIMKNKNGFWRRAEVGVPIAWRQGFVVGPRKQVSEIVGMVMPSIVEAAAVMEDANVIVAQAVENEAEQVSVAVQQMEGVQTTAVEAGKDAEISPQILAEMESADTPTTTVTAVDENQDTDAADDGDESFVEVYVSTIKIMVQVGTQWVEAHQDYGDRCDCAEQQSMFAEVRDLFSTQPNLQETVLILGLITPAVTLGTAGGKGVDHSSTPAAPHELTPEEAVHMLGPLPEFIFPAPVAGRHQCDISVVTCGQTVSLTKRQLEQAKSFHTALFAAVLKREDVITVERDWACLVVPLMDSQHYLQNGGAQGSRPGAAKTPDRPPEVDWETVQMVHELASEYEILKKEAVVTVVEVEAGQAGKQTFTIEENANGGEMAANVPGAKTAISTENGQDAGSEKKEPEAAPLVLFKKEWLGVTVLDWLRRHHSAGRPFSPLLFHQTTRGISVKGATLDEATVEGVEKLSLAEGARSVNGHSAQEAEEFKTTSVNEKFDKWNKEFLAGNEEVLPGVYKAKELAPQDHKSNPFKPYALVDRYYYGRKYIVLEVLWDVTPVTPLGSPNNEGPEGADQINSILRGKFPDLASFYRYRLRCAEDVDPNQPVLKAVSLAYVTQWKKQQRPSTLRSPNEKTGANTAENGQDTPWVSVPGKPGGNVLATNKLNEKLMKRKVVYLIPQFCHIHPIPARMLFDEAVHMPMLIRLMNHALITRDLAFRVGLKAFTGLYKQPSPGSPKLITGFVEPTSATSGEPSSRTSAVVSASSSSLPPASMIPPATIRRANILFTLLQAALTSPSAGVPYDFERLETLGDSFLKVQQSLHLFAQHPDRHEGWLSKARNILERNTALTGIVMKMGVLDALLVGTLTRLDWVPPSRDWAGVGKGKEIEAGAGVPSVENGQAEAGSEVPSVETGNAGAGDGGEVTEHIQPVTEHVQAALVFDMAAVEKQTTKASEERRARLPPKKRQRLMERSEVKSRMNGVSVPSVVAVDTVGSSQSNKDASITKITPQQFVNGNDHVHMDVDEHDAESNPVVTGHSKAEFTFHVSTEETRVGKTTITKIAAAKSSSAADPKSVPHKEVKRQKKTETKATKNSGPQDDDEDSPTSDDPDRTSVSEKTVADCVEAIIGACLLVGGIKGGAQAIQALLDQTYQVDWSVYEQQLRNAGYFWEQKSGGDDSSEGNDAVATTSEAWEAKAASLGRLEERIGYKFKDRRLAVEALTHPSVAALDAHARCYQRLEFLGDAVLGFLIMRHIFHLYPTLSPGALSEYRSSLVNNQFLSCVSGALSLHKQLDHVSPSLAGALVEFGEMLDRHLVRLGMKESDEDEEMEGMRRAGKGKGRLGDFDQDGGDADMDEDGGSSSSAGVTATAGTRADAGSSMDIDDIGESTVLVDLDAQITEKDTSQSQVRSRSDAQRKESASGAEKGDNFWMDEKPSPKAVADVYESIIGAVFLDSGLHLPTVWGFIKRTLWDPWIDILGDPDAGAIHPVKEFWDLVQGELKCEVVEVSCNYNQHDATYVCDMTHHDTVMGSGKGPSKRVAKHEAARSAVGYIKKHIAELREACSCRSKDSHRVKEVEDEDDY
ncbi:hypothetical protein HK102_009973 [Quaeritorhiza haematococci]|nr:hypothetical protein HK102_009973 [Quaeritorhiza haematococci]